MIEFGLMVIVINLLTIGVSSLTYYTITKFGEDEVSKLICFSLILTIMSIILSIIYIANYYWGFP